MIWLFGHFALGALSDHDPLHLSDLRILGRTARTEVQLYWTGSGLELNFWGSELWIEVDVDWDVYEPWLSALEQGRLLFRMPLQRGRQWLLVFRGLDGAKGHRIQILRETQPMPDRLLSVRVLTIRLDGALRPLPAPSYRLEFIGDSYTSAQGAMGAANESDNMTTLWYTAACGYPRLAAQRLNADFRVLSHNGWGVASSSRNAKSGNMMDNYEAISGMAPKGSKGANFNQNNFSAWVPHAIVVALGTNDGSAWGRDAVTDPETGETFRNTPEIFEAKAFEFLVKLRKYNPTALLAWLFYEQDTNGVNQILDRVIAKYRRERDENCLIFRIQQFAVKEGANGHPSREQHEEWASQVVEKLGPILKGLK